MLHKRNQISNISGSTVRKKKVNTFGLPKMRLCSDTDT